MLGDLLFVTFAILGGLFATISDLKTLEVPDFLNYFLVLFGLGGHLIVSIMTWNYWPFALSLIVAGILFAVANVMYYTGQWGGGDAKLLIGFGALLPIFPAALLNYVSPVIAPWPFIFTLWVNIFVFGAIFGLIATVYLALKHRQKFAKEVKRLYQRFKLGIMILLVLVVVPTVLLVFNSVFFNLAIFLWCSAAGVSLLFLFAKAVENSAMHKFIAPSELTLGDWVKDIKIKDKVIYKKEREGLTEKSMKKLIRIEAEGKLKKVLIKEGIPFVPSFLAGLLVSLFYGDIVFMFFLRLL